MLHSGYACHSEVGVCTGVSSRAKTHTIPYEEVRKSLITFADDEKPYFVGYLVVHHLLSPQNIVRLCEDCDVPPSSILYNEHILKLVFDRVARAIPRCSHYKSSAYIVLPVLHEREFIDCLYALHHSGMNIKPKEPNVITVQIPLPERTHFFIHGFGTGSSDSLAECLIYLQDLYYPFWTHAKRCGRSSKDSSKVNPQVSYKNIDIRPHLTYFPPTGLLEEYPLLAFIKKLFPKAYEDENAALNFDVKNIVSCRSLTMLQYTLISRREKIESTLFSILLDAIAKNEIK